MYKQLLKNIKCKKHFNVCMKNMNTYRIDFNADCLIYPENVDQIKKIIKICKDNNIKYKFIGECSNLIFTSDYKGVLIKLDKLDNIKIDDTEIIVEAGYNLKKLAMKSIREGLTGLEFATGIPGVLGSAIYNNSGAYKSDMGYIVESVLVLTPSLELKKMYNKDLNYHYRDSFFKHNSEYVILEATLILKKGDKEKSLELVEDRKKRRIMSQPLEFPSAGSVFRNPTDMYAGELIEKLKLKNYEVNGAYVSEKHANFIINKNNANGKDIVDLINIIKNKVKENYDIDLILEQEIVNG